LCGEPFVGREGFPAGKESRFLSPNGDAVARTVFREEPAMSISKEVHQENSFTYDLARFIPFRDAEACARARAVTKEEMAHHPNPDFHIKIIEDAKDFYFAFALDIVECIQRARDESKPFVAILPVGPVPQFTFVAKMINRLGIPLSHVHTFNMDE